MSVVSPNPVNATPGEPPRPVVRIPPELRLAAAARLVSDQSLDPMEAARRFLESAKALKIDLTQMWGTLAPNGLDVRQVCLAVVGSGRTAMLFVSGPARSGSTWFASARRKAASGTDDQGERIAVIRTACDALSKGSGSDAPGVALAQALLESREREAAAALRTAGFMQLGELAYMRLALSSTPKAVELAPASGIQWPPGVQVRSVESLLAEGWDSQRVDEALSLALERTYVDTLDCPELCGLRSVRDVLESHRAVGVHHPAFWWLLFDEHGPQGCALFSVCPEQDSIELVYLGVSPAIRGHGVGRSLFKLGLSELYQRAIYRGDEFEGASTSPTTPRVAGLGGVTCAVDTRNQPAVKLYRSLGFQRFATRVPLVKRLES